MAPAHPTGKKYAEQQHICHGYNAIGEKTMALAHLIREKYTTQREICASTRFVAMMLSKRETSPVSPISSKEPIFVKR